VPQHPQEGRCHRHPFRDPAAGSPPVALDDEIRIDADRRVIDEDLAIDLAEIDHAGLAATDCRRGAVEVEREAEILGEMIERSERNDAERHPRSSEHTRHGADAAVAASGDDRVDVAAPRLPKRP
jgi:hypothetical protein